MVSVANIRSASSVYSYGACMGGSHTAGGTTGSFWSDERC